ncbi:uncharacterized protein B0T15DRAFT_493008 [Chaetomium strumarium]|uniref:Uncharacterized protein n=1 Tax=Chaetomium strumarium TaxID=1170767 RepID=A0AAJ0M3M6_9PEZI|nr:hypothetical protein B0T15DRAFT_493008 [Chaetomium strumarium]
MSRMELRPAALRRRPGRYREDDGPTRAERPAFVHPDVPFNERLAEFCAHPTLPLDYPGVGPAEAERLRLAAVAAAGAEQADVTDDEHHSSEEGSKNDDDDSDHEGAGAVTNHGAESQDQSGEERVVDEGPRPATGDGPVAASQSVAPVNPDVGQGRRARPAYVANIPRQQPSKTNRIGEAPAFPPPAATPSPTISTNPPEQLNWSDLSDGIKYAIVFEMTREMRLSEALQQLNLTHDEVQSFLVLVQKEIEKIETCDANLEELLDFDDPSVRATIAALAPVTDPLTAAEVRRGRSYLRLLGINHVAANLGLWEGTAGTWHRIDIDEGCLDLLGVDNLGGVDLVSGSSSDVMSNMSDAELLVRLDPPARTLNPQRLRSGAPPSERGRACDLQRVPKSGSLHPANYVHSAKSGRSYSILDKSDWPQWEALHDAGIIPQTVLTVATMQSQVPNEVWYLSGEEAEAMDVDRPEELLGSLPAPDQGFIDAVVGPEPSPGSAQGNESQNP